MTVTVASFRTNYPEFQDIVGFPDSGVNYWLNLAGLLLNAPLWGSLLDHGKELFIAHNIVLEFKAQAEATNGGAPGITTGPVQLKVVDKVQVQYDVQHGIVKDAGHWNNTVYGTRFINLAKMFGSVPIHIGGDVSGNVGWYGPSMY